MRPLVSALFSIALLSPCLVAQAVAAEPPSPPPAAPRIRGLDVPEAVVTRRVRDSELTEGQVDRECSVFAKYALVWTNDPGLVGAESLEVRARAAGASAEAMCAEPFAGRRLLGADPESGAARYPIGIVARWLVLQTGDGLGELIGLGLVDLEAGRVVLDAGYHYARGIDFARTAKGITATYWQQVEEFPCVPRAGERGCWARIRRQHGIPAKVPAPDCEEAVKGLAAPIERPSHTVQITVHVRRALPGGATEYLPDRPTCDPTP